MQVCIENQELQSFTVVQLSGSFEWYDNLW